MDKLSDILDNFENTLGDYAAFKYGLIFTSGYTLDCAHYMYSHSFIAYQVR